MEQSLRSELTSQILQPPGEDRRIAAFCQALLTTLQAPNENAELLDVIYRISGHSPSYVVNHVLRALQRQLLTYQPDYPRAFISAAVWLEALHEVVQTPAKWRLFKSDLCDRSVQSNVVERYKAIKLAVNLLRPQQGSSLALLDIGCSRNHGLKKLRLNLPFTEVTCAVQSFGTMPSIVLDRLLNEALQVPLQLSACLGMDVVPLTLGQDAAWAKSCSFYPSELLQSRAVAEYDYLDSLRLNGVDFIEADIAVAVPPIGTFDVVILSTFLYQLEPAARHRARQQVAGLLAEDGLIIYQDFSHTNASDSQLEFEANWFSQLFPYRTIIEFASDPGRLYELFRWNNGRCAEWIPGKDLAAALQKR
ncbi:MAG: hypothetical protein JWN38_950 [Candidatus Saccharibacteria bacterium]|nr:hypothetical protein [Candidatus Saccharibacteria bacterium]